MFITKYVFHFIDGTNSIALYHKMRLQIWTNYMSILKKLMHIKPTIKLKDLILGNHENSVCLKKCVYKLKFRY